MIDWAVSEWLGLEFLINKMVVGNEMVVCLRLLKLHKYQAILCAFELIMLFSLSCCYKRSRRTTVGEFAHCHIARCGPWLYTPRQIIEVREAQQS